MCILPFKLPQSHDVRKAPRFCFTLLALLGVYGAGLLLRYRFIFEQNRPTDPANIFGDIEWYFFESERIFTTDYVPTLYDTLFPPGTSIYIAVMRWLDPSMHALIVSQWVLASLVPSILGYTALRLFGQRNAIFVFLFSSLYFPLWEYFGYLFSEGPFIVLMSFGFLLMLLSLSAQGMKGAVLWGSASGIAFGAAAICKSVALFSLVLVFAALLFYRLRHRFRLVVTIASLVTGIAIILIPVSIRSTRLNEGRFLLIANDASRTFLLGHQGRVGLTWWVDSARNFHMNFINPSTIQHSYGETKTYPFGVYDNAANYAAGLQWVAENPLEATLLSFEHVFDMFAVALPYPGYYRPYSRWVTFFNQVFLALIFLPAIVHILRSYRGMLHADPQLVGDAMIFAAVVSIFIIAFLFLGEGRYRICYDGFMLLLASRAFFPRASELDV